jgi:hypothetical protein
MEQAKVKELKKGWYVNHPKYGNIQYRGLATKHPYTEKPKVPHLHIFWQCVDEDGNTQPDVVETNGNLILEVTDKFEDND